MEKKNESSKLISLFIILMIAVVLVGVLASQAQSNTSKTSVSNEVVTVASAKVDGTNLNASQNLGPVTNYPTGWKVEDCPLTAISVTNASGTALTVTTDYTLSSTTGILNLVNSSTTINAFSGSNNSLVSYQYCGNGYVNSSWARTLLNTNVGLFALGILIAAIGVVLYILKSKEDD